MSLDNNWFTEICQSDHSAFSLKSTKRLHSEKTTYQQIDIYETTGFGNLMVIDGFVMLTARDNFFYHEMMTHPALFAHAAPSKVAIIGGGDCGSLLEVLKHDSVTDAWQIEIDERVTQLSEIYFPQLCSANQDPRAHFEFCDGIQWVKDCQAGSIDILIIDSTDPIGPAVGLFTEAFYRDCHQALGDNGILIQQSESPLFHTQLIKDMHVAMKSAGFDGCNTLNFPQPCYPSGWWSSTMAGKNSQPDQFREMDSRNKDFATRYYTADMHRAALALPAFLQEALDQ